MPEMLYRSKRGTGLTPSPAAALDQEADPNPDIPARFGFPNRHGNRYGYDHGDSSVFGGHGTAAHRAGRCLPSRQRRWLGASPHVRQTFFTHGLRSSLWEGRLNHRLDATYFVGRSST